jgi:hypothetical protein
MEAMSVIPITIFTGQILPLCFPVMPTVTERPGTFTWTPLLMKTVFILSSGPPKTMPGTTTVSAAGILPSKIKQGTNPNEYQ